MDLVTIIKAILPVEPSQLRPDSKNLQPGDHLLGRVLKLHGDGKAVMDFNTFRALTEIPMEVRVGQTLNLEVAQVGHPLKLRIVPADVPPPGPDRPASVGGSGMVPVKELLQQLQADLKTLESRSTDSQVSVSPPSPQNIQTALKTLSTYLAGLDLNSDAKTLAADLQSKVENSGLLFENKIAAVLEHLSTAQMKTEPEAVRAQINRMIGSDFKFNAMQLLEYLDKADLKSSHLEETATQRLQGALKEMLDDLGRQKNVAVKRLAMEDSYQIFQMALPFAEKKEAAGLKVYYAKKKKKDPQTPPKVSLLLDLENIGLIRSDFLMMQKDLSVSIYVGDSDIKNYFDAQMDAVKKRLEEHFETVSLAVRVSEKKIKEFDAPLQTEDHEYKVDLRI